jgi:hypothetical protein
LSRGPHAKRAIGLLVLFACSCAGTRPPSRLTSTISGTITNSTNLDTIAGARVVIECECLATPREVLSNADGFYRVDRLGPGRHAIHVFAGVAEVVKIIELRGGSKLRANFTIDPDDDVVHEFLIDPEPRAVFACP